MTTDSSEAQLCLPPLPLTTAPPRLPEGTCDAHFHVFRAGAPLSSPRNYTPQIRTLTDWQDFAAAANIDSGVLIQPSVYGFDNSVLLEALAADPGRLRGIVVIPPDLPDAELDALDSRGVRGIRVNVRNKGGLPLSAVEILGKRLARLGWTLQFQVSPSQLVEIAEFASRLPVPAVIDHAGFIPLGMAETAGHIAMLQRLLDGGNCYVKLSAPYRLSPSGDYSGFALVARALARSHPHRLLWGSDWPHTELWNAMPDDAELLAAALAWLPDLGIRQQVFAGNARTLFFAR